VGLERAVGAAGTRARPRIEDGALLGSRCASCGARSWPGRAVCSRCGSDDLEAEPLPREASLRSYTAVWVARAHFDVPYVLGQVDFGDGAVVFGHVRGLEDDAAVPLRVRLVVPDEAGPLAFWFEPTVA
jgi:uncharacterized OB-fold protein